MKLSITTLAAASSLVAAQPVLNTRDATVNDTANDMSDAVSGSGPCKDNAVIFARGTFDSGNIGVWVGPQFFQSVQQNVKSVALQGVDPNGYPADLHGYLSEGGSNSGAQAMADQIEQYAQKCPNSKIFVTGWSQGALVAHKALSTLDQNSSPALENIASVVTFGDPNKVWDQMPLPASILDNHFQSECVSDPVADPLCAGIKGIFHIPTAEGIISSMQSLVEVATNDQQKAAAESLLAQFPGQLLSSWKGFTTNLLPERFIRLELSPQHFTYGINGMATEAGAWVGNQVNGL